MERILSQEEINALFSGMSPESLSGGDFAENLVLSSKVSEYDFRRADRISQDQMRSLHLLHDYFSRNLSASLSAYLRAFVGVSLISVDQVSYMEFLRTLPDPTLFTTLAMRQLRGNAALELNPSVAFPMIDMLLGGPGNPPQSERGLTEIEINIIEGVIRLALRDLKEAWRPVMELDFILEGVETKHQIFQIVAPTEAVVALGFEIKLGENSGMMNLCIPSRMLRLIRNKFDQQWQMRREKMMTGERSRIRDLLQNVPVPAGGEIRDYRLTAGELISLEVGDIVRLGHRIGEAVLVSIGGMPKFKGRIVASRGKRGIEITQVLP